MSPEAARPTGILTRVPRGKIGVRLVGMGDHHSLLLEYGTYEGLEGLRQLCRSRKVSGGVLRQHGKLLLVPQHDLRLVEEVRLVDQRVDYAVRPPARLTAGAHDDSTGTGAATDR